MTERELRSGLVVDVPAAESAVRVFRESLDPTAGLGVPAHISVLFPFVPAGLVDGSVAAAVRSAVGGVGRFSFELTHSEWFGSEVLWLGPTATEEFVKLTTMVRDAFPLYLPYDGQFTGLVPHLTVADRAPSEAMHAAERKLQRHLPIRCEATSVLLLIEQVTGRWTRAARFSLG